MFSKLFKYKKRDVVQYILVLTVISLILAFAFPKIRDKMGATTKSTVNNIDVGMGNMFSNSQGGESNPIQCTLPPVDHDVPSNYRYYNSYQYEYYDDINNGSGETYRIYLYSNAPVTFYIANISGSNTVIEGNRVFSSFSWWDTTNGITTFDNQFHLLQDSPWTDVLGGTTAKFTTLPQITCDSSLKI